MSLTRALYAGSFDPITNGHLWMICKGLELFGDNFTVAVGINPDKKYMFTLEERVAMIKQSVVATDPGYTNADKHTLHVISMGQRLLVDLCFEHKINYVLRGIRDFQDFVFEQQQYEINMALWAQRYIPAANWTWSPMYIPAPKKYAAVSSSLVKGLLDYEDGLQSIAHLVPQTVYKILKEREDKRFNALVKATEKCL